MIGECATLVNPDKVLSQRDKELLWKLSCFGHMVPSKDEWRGMRSLCRRGYAKVGEKHQGYALSKAGLALVRGVKDHAWIFDATPTRVRNFDGKHMMGTTTRGRANVLVKYGYALWWNKDTIQFLYDVLVDGGMHRIARRIVEAREGGKCFWCGEPADTLDHLLPQVHGGLSLVENLVLSCRSCNQARGASIPANIEAVWDMLHERTDRTAIPLCDGSLMTIQKWLTNRGIGAMRIREISQAAAVKKEILNSLLALRATPPIGRELLRESIARILGPTVETAPANS